MSKFCIVVMITLFGLSFVGISTAIAEEECGTGTPGYWMNHPEAWLTESITIGGTTYSKQDAIDWMKAPVQGDKTLTLFRAYVAAFLNVSQVGCVPPVPEPICPELIECYPLPLGHPNYPGQECRPLPQAYLWLDDNPVGSQVRANSSVWQQSHGEDIYDCLDAYNNGYRNAPSRDSLD